MLYQRAGVTLDVPYSELLMSPPEPEDDAPSDTLALTDQSADAEMLEPELPNPDAVAAEMLAQGLEQVQAYEEQQRQDLAAQEDAQVIEANPSPAQAVAV
jgi:hypothetical protein